MRTILLTTLLLASTALPAPAQSAACETLQDVRKEVASDPNSTMVELTPESLLGAADTAVKTLIFVSTKGGWLTFGFEGKDGCVTGPVTISGMQKPDVGV